MNPGKSVHSSHISDFFLSLFGNINKRKRGSDDFLTMDKEKAQRRTDLPIEDLPVSDGHC